MRGGRQDSVEGITITHAPFYDLIGLHGFNGGEIPESHVGAVKQLVRDVVEVLRSKIDIINFWEQKHEIKQLKGNLSDSILFTGVEELINNSEKTVSEITALAEKRHKDIINANL